MQTAPPSEDLKDTEKNKTEASSEAAWVKSYPDNVNWQAPLLPQTLPQLLAAATAQFSKKPALEFMGQETTYAKLAQKVAAMAKILKSLGIQKGSRIGLFMPNCPAFVVSFFGVLQAGGIVVNVNPLYAEQEIENEIHDAGIDLMITLDLALLYNKLEPMIIRKSLKRILVFSMSSMLPPLKALLFPLLRKKEIARMPQDSRHLRYEDLLATIASLSPDGEDVSPDGRDVSPDDIAVLQYTGGTTGTPKAAMLSHANLTINVQQSRLWFPALKDGEEKVLAALPLFHVFAMTTIMNLGLHIGAKIILLPKFDLHSCIKTIHKMRPTLFPAVPTIYTAINNFKQLSKFDLSSIRYCISGGAPLPVEVKAAFEKLTGCTLVEGYGLTESSPVAACNPVVGDNKPGSIGLPLPGTKIEIISLEDGETVLPAGERGEVCLRGPQIMRGYWNKPDETAMVLRSGRLHTGDAGLMDAAGYTFITDRIKDMILCSGYNVYPRMVEEAIYQHPAVAECAVAGLKDAYRGQTVKAWLRLKEGQSLTREDLLTFLEKRLSPMEQPKYIEFRQEPLPKTLIGKISRKLLLEEEGNKKKDAPSP